MKTKIEQVFFTILGMIGFAVALMILIALVEMGERFAELFI